MKGSDIFTICKLGLKDVYNRAHSLEHKQRIKELINMRSSDCSFLTLYAIEIGVQVFNVSNRERGRIIDEIREDIDYNIKIFEMVKKSYQLAKSRVEGGKIKLNEAQLNKKLAKTLILMVSNKVLTCFNGFGQKTSTINSGDNFLPYGSIDLSA